MAMDLICMAHRGEAQTFINKLGLKSNDRKFYSNDNGISLLLTGEGSIDVLTRLPYYLAKFPIKSILNIGIAGALNDSIKIKDIFKISNISSFSEGQKRFKSFEIESNSKLTCISSDKRVLDDELASLIRPHADIVDMEAWPIAKAANEYNIPFECYKLVSDIAGGNTECSDIKKMAREFSDQMYNHFISLNTKS